eukprot:CAMPEP_0197844312 /NCGR_PEP_ID=MMETSP1438-20131217/1292_1 /TAXON_ID=1461541 /ORGANISM="Pterosperma sp., Strain CCMP1384" /LENGTH=381 /DNA_ID=CAMNT_0043455029 /DNA_START=229 /DNA_END=1374 /DNA_ORIENTATION=+
MHDMRWTSVNEYEHKGDEYDSAALARQEKLLAQMSMQQSMNQEKAEHYLRKSGKPSKYAAESSSTLPSPLNLDSLRPLGPMKSGAAMLTPIGIASSSDSQLPAIGRRNTSDAVRQETKEEREARKRRRKREKERERERPRNREEEEEPEYMDDIPDDTSRVIRARKRKEERLMHEANDGLLVERSSKRLTARDQGFDLDPSSMPFDDPLLLSGEHLEKLASTSQPGSSRQTDASSRYAQSHHDREDVIPIIDYERGRAYQASDSPSPALQHEFTSPGMEQPKKAKSKPPTLPRLGGRVSEDTRRGGPIVSDVKPLLCVPPIQGTERNAPEDTSSDDRDLEPISSRVGSRKPSFVQRMKERFSDTIETIDKTVDYYKYSSSF